MREIKFRQAIFIDGKFNSWHYWGFSKEGFVAPADVCLREAEKNSDQFTGLKDKNGNEIYGGNKLQDSIDGDIGTVYWKESAAGFYVKWGDGSDMSLNYGVATCKCEIIGGIHQSELMEQDNA